MIGRNFSTEGAPCTDRRELRGVFDAGVRQGNLNAIFEYLFDFKMKPTTVKVHGKSALSDGTYWIFVQRL